MRIDQAQGQESEPTKTPPSPPAPPEPPSRKRLLADPETNQGSAAASSDSVLSSGSSSDRFRKKTRDLPNLSDCHGCGLRINNTSPKAKLQTLESVWRIVLLCKKCIKRVESAELCSYCFSDIDADCYNCRECERRVHRDCVLKYRCFAPWSYCCSDSGFSVCIDCWVPKLLVNSNRVYGRRNKKNELKQCSVSDSRVLPSGGSPKVLHDVVNNAKGVVGKISAVAVQAKKKALRKSAVPKRAADLVNRAMELVAKKDVNDVNDDSSLMGNCDSGSTAMIVDDAELAFQLHRAMNSSPRISRNVCLINSSCLTLPRVRDCKLVRSSASSGSANCSSCAKIEVCTDNDLNEKSCRTVSESSVHVTTSGSGSRIGLGSFVGKVYTRRCKKYQCLPGKWRNCCKLRSW